jgi:hypothetical protein
MKRFNIMTLMTVILYMALSLGALFDPAQSLIWSSTIYTMCAVILMTSTLMAFLRRGPERAAWMGFAVFGWSYLLLLGFDVQTRFPKPPLLTTLVLNEILESMRYLFEHSVEMASFAPVGHAAFLFLFSLVGAVLGLVFARRRGAAAYGGALLQKEGKASTAA